MKKTSLILLISAAVLAASPFSYAGEIIPDGTKTGVPAVMDESNAVTVIKGKIVDSSTSEPEIGAVIQFFQASNLEKPVAYTTTDVDGFFSHPIDSEGEYILVYSGLGKKTLQRSFTLSGESEIDLGTILTQDDAEVLEAGKVVALKNLVKMDVDKISYKVSDDQDSKTYTLLDMLRKVPMVSVDAQDNITVNGSSSFQILVDGKPNAMISSNPSIVLKSIPATFASDIEVITNPGVKYDAEGVGGVLNIKTNKAQGASTASLDGYNASVSLGYSTTGVSGSGFVTMQKGKFSASANVSAIEANIPGASSETLREQLASDGSVVSSMKMTSETGINAPVRLASVNLGYEIDPQRLVSASFGVMGVTSHTNNINNTELYAGNTLLSSYGSETKAVWDVNSITAGVDYQRTFKDNPNKVFTLSYLFSSSPSVTDSKSIFDGSVPTLFNRYTDGNTNTLEHTVQADFTTKFGEKLSFDTGAKYINRMNRSDQTLYLDDNGTWVENTAGSMIYRHANNIAAGYAELSYPFGKWSAKAGARYEHTFQNVTYRLGNGEDFSMDYGNFVPAASLQYNIGMTQNIGLSYNMRISRPGITYLNPYMDISDPTAKSYGNPDLETEKAHTLGLTYNYLSQKFILNANLRHTYTGNGIGSYNFYDEYGLLNSTYANNAENSTTGLSLMAMFNFGKVTRLIVTGGLTYSDMKNESLGLHNYGWSSTALASLQTSLPWDVRLSTNLIWTSRTKTVDGWSKGLTIATAGLSKSILSDRLTFSASVTTPATLGKCLEIETYGKGPDYRQSTVSKTPMRVGAISVKYAFGSSKGASVKKTRKSISNDDLMNKSNSTEAAGYMNQSGGSSSSSLIGL